MGSSSRASFLLSPKLGGVRSPFHLWPSRNSLSLHGSSPKPTSSRNQPPTLPKCGPKDLQKASYNPSRADVRNRRRGCVRAEGGEGHGPQNEKNSPKRGPKVQVIDEFGEQRFIRRLIFPNSSLPNQNLFSGPALETAHSLPSTRGNCLRKPTICPFHSKGDVQPWPRAPRRAGYWKWTRSKLLF